MPLLAARAMFSLAILTTTRCNPNDAVLASGKRVLVGVFSDILAIPMTMLKRDRSGRLLWRDQFDRATWRFLPEIAPLDI
jgi:hypothetical protein